MVVRRPARSQSVAIVFALLGILYAQGRWTVRIWLRAAGISDDYQDDDYLLVVRGRKAESVAVRRMIVMLQQLPLPKRMLLVIDDWPTKRYGPHVVVADIHRNPMPGRSGQICLYGHIYWLRRR